MTTGDVVVVGGGIVGSSIAYHLTAAGCSNVGVIERETQQGKGSTGSSMGAWARRSLLPSRSRCRCTRFPCTESAKNVCSQFFISSATVVKKVTQ